MPRQLDHYPDHIQNIRRNRMDLDFPRQFDAVRLSIPSIVGPTNDGAFRAMSQAVLRWIRHRTGNGVFQVRE